jgi:hypothetical protein
LSKPTLPDEETKKDLVAATNRAVAAAARLDPSNLTRSIRSDHATHRGHSVESTQITSPQDPAPRGVMALAVRHGAVPANQTRELERLSAQPRRVPRALSEEERARWFRALVSD